MDIDKLKQLVNETWLDLPNAVLNQNPEIVNKVSKVTEINSTVPHMSTTHIGLMISLIASCLNEDESYVNIGTWKGFSFFEGFINNPNIYCFGNDNFSLFTKDHSGSTTDKDALGRWFGDPREDFYRVFNRLKTDRQKFVDGDWLSVFFADFRKMTDKKIGFYFYDGDHSFESQYKALNVVQEYLSEKCVILVDDTNMPDVKNANDKFLAENSNFKVLYDLPTPCNRYPTWWDGLQIIVRNG